MNDVKKPLEGAALEAAALLADLFNRRPYTDHRPAEFVRLLLQTQEETAKRAAAEAWNAAISVVADAGMSAHADDEARIVDVCASLVTTLQEKRR